MANVLVVIIHQSQYLVAQKVHQTSGHNDIPSFSTSRVSPLVGDALVLLESLFLWNLHCDFSPTYQSIAYGTRCNLHPFLHREDFIALRTLNILLGILCVASL